MKGNLMENGSGAIVVVSILVLISLIVVVVKGYLFLGRRVAEEKRMIWLAGKVAFATSIAVCTFCSTIYGWRRGENIDVYLTFLIVTYSIIDAVDNFKEYKNEEKRVRG